MARYPGYTGDLDVSGSVVVEDFGGKVQLTYDLSGLETSAEGGLHIHTGTSCTDSATVGGHLYVAVCTGVSLTAPFCNQLAEALVCGEKPQRTLNFVSSLRAP